MFIRNNILDISRYLSPFIAKIMHLIYSLSLSFNSTLIVEPATKFRKSLSIFGSADEKTFGSDFKTWLATVAGPKAKLANGLGLRHGHVDQAQSAELLCACAGVARRSAAAGGARVCMCLIVNKQRVSKENIFI